MHVGGNPAPFVLQRRLFFQQFVLDPDEFVCRFQFLPVHVLPDHPVAVTQGDGKKDDVDETAQDQPIRRAYPHGWRGLELGDKGGQAEEKITSASQQNERLERDVPQPEALIQHDGRQEKDKDPDGDKPRSVRF